MSALVISERSKKFTQIICDFLFEVRVRHDRSPLSSYKLRWIAVPLWQAYHTAVWTGSEMIICGGWDDYDFFNTGGIYDPGTDSWKATSMTNVPGARFAHTAVWTGSEMVVWGGANPPA